MTATQEQHDFSDLIRDLEKEFGAGAIRQGDDQNEPMDWQTIPTGSLNLDQATGIGGIPLGRITEIYGPEGSGKSTLSLHIMAQAQSLEHAIAYVDAEHAMDKRYAATCGLNTDRMLISQPDSAEQALNVVDRLANDGRVRLIVVDSVHAMTPQEEIDKNVGEDTVALLPRLMSTSLRKVNPALSRNEVALVFTNQLRDTIAPFGPKETTTGGRALKFYASMRIELRRGESIRDRGRIIGQTTKARIAKNKCAAPFLTAEFDIYFAEGISMESEILERAVDEGIIDKAGAFYSYQGERLAQGRDNARSVLKNDRQLHDDILQQLRDNMSTTRAAA